MNPDDTITITVPADSLEAARAGARRGEHWIDERGRPVEWCTTGQHYHRVEEPVLCPACGEEMRVSHGVDWWMLCDRCGVRGPFADSESAAREAWRKMMGGGR